MLDNTNELGELKSLLFEEEIDAFNALEKQIETLRLQQHSIEDVLEKIKPLLDDFLEERLSHTDTRTTQIYAQYLSQIISKSVALDSDRLSKALQPVISPAIGKEIEENQDKMVDALYPIMGSLISKYVSNAIQEMMEKINTKVEDGLSFGSYKRKMKSKISGVSESELLLEESADALVHSLFIIEKDSSLLVAEGHLENQEIADPHMVASMASAIKDFVNDWIVNNHQNTEVQLLSYGNATLYIESAGSVYLIAFLDTEPDYEQRREIQAFFAGIVKKYSEFFQKFDGDDEAKEILAIENELYTFLNTPLHDSTDTKHPMGLPKKSYLLKFTIFLLLGSFVIYATLKMIDRYETYTLEQSIANNVGENISIDKKGDSLYLSGTIKDINNYPIIQKILKQKGIKIVNHIFVPFYMVEKQISKQKESIQYLNNRILSIETKIHKYD